MKEMSASEALRHGIRLEMKRDDRIFVLGEDARDRGGPFGIYKGLLEEFGPKRVVDTPISEAAIVGTAIGAAVTGLRPIAMLGFNDFFGVCMDQIMNQAAKMRYMFGGKIQLPLVLQATKGAGFSAAAHHSQSLEALCLHIPGLKVVIPSGPNEAAGLIRSAIRDNNPVVYLIDKVVLARMKEEVPEEAEPIPLGQAKVHRPGENLTIVAWGTMVSVAMNSVEALQELGVDPEIIDLRTISPMDLDTVVDSVSKTNRLVILHEACRTGGAGGTLASLVMERAFDDLDSPIKVVGAPDTPVPYSPVLEKFFLPDVENVVKAVRGMVG